MLRQASQVAQTPEKSKVFCFFSSEKKALLAFAHLLDRGLAAEGRNRRAMFNRARHV